MGAWFRRHRRLRTTALTLAFTGALTAAGRIAWGWFEDVSAAVAKADVVENRLENLDRGQALLTQDLREMRRGQSVIHQKLDAITTHLLSKK